MTGTRWNPVAGTQYREKRQNTVPNTVRTLLQDNTAVSRSSSSVRSYLDRLFRSFTNMELGGVLLSHPSAAAASASRRRSLLIGINNYGQKALHGCVNDIERVRELLHSKLQVDCEVIPEAQALKPFILERLAHYADITTTADSFLFYFSGHGSQLSNPTKHNGSNETFVAWYGGSGGISSWLTSDAHHVTDDELVDALSQFKSRNVTLIFDSCHSGDIARSPADDASARCVSPVHPAIIPGSRDSTPKPGSGWVGLGAFNFVVLSACTDRQTAAERSFTVQRTGSPTPVTDVYGVLTHVLCETLEALPAKSIFGMSWRSVAESVQEKVKALHLPQLPQLEGLRDWLILGRGPVSRTAEVRINFEFLETAVLCAGTAHGVQVGSIWSASAGASALSSESSPQAQTVELEPVSGDYYGVLSRVQPAMQEHQPPGAKARCIKTYFGADAVRVRLPVGESHQVSLLDKIRSHLLATIYAVPVPPEDGGAEFKLSIIGGRVMLCQLEASRAASSQTQQTAGYLSWTDAVTDDVDLFLCNCDKLLRQHGLLTRVASGTHLMGLDDRKVKVQLLTGSRALLALSNLEPVTTVGAGNTLSLQITNDRGHVRHSDRVRRCWNDQSALSSAGWRADAHRSRQDYGAETSQDERRHTPWSGFLCQWHLASHLASDPLYHSYGLHISRAGRAGACQASRGAERATAAGRLNCSRPRANACSSGRVTPSRTSTSFCSLSRSLVSWKVCVAAYIGTNPGTQTTSYR